MSLSEMSSSGSDVHSDGRRVPSEIGGVSALHIAPRLARYSDRVNNPPLRLITMSPSLTSLPAELQLVILCSTDDLDDASSLSHTCKLLQSLYTTHQKTIEGGVIV